MISDAIAHRRRSAAGGRGEALVRGEALADRLPPLLVAAERVAATVSQGVHGRRRVGQGETFWQFRRYEPGDSTQQIDWRQSAKSQRVFIRQTEWEAAQSVWLWRDGSPSMIWHSHDGLAWKRDRAELLLLALASLLARGGEHMALLGDASAPGTGRPALGRLLTGLARTASATAEGSSSVPPLKPLPRFARLVLLGDFLASLEDIAAVLRAYAQRGIRGHLMQITDPAEETLPFSGRVRLEGCEHDGEALIGRVESVRAAYGAAFEGHRQGLAALSGSVDWTFAVHRTDQPAEPALLALYTALSTPRRQQAQC
jgi:uncharacterized protein (DUF58 family)